MKTITNTINGNYYETPIISEKLKKEFKKNQDILPVLYTKEDLLRLSPEEYQKYKAADLYQNILFRASVQAHQSFAEYGTHVEVKYNGDLMIISCPSNEHEYFMDDQIYDYSDCSLLNEMINDFQSQIIKANILRWREQHQNFDLYKEFGGNARIMMVCSYQKDQTLCTECLESVVKNIKAGLGLLDVQKVYLTVRYIPLKLEQGEYTKFYIFPDADLEKYIHNSKLITDLRSKDICLIK